MNQRPIPEELTLRLDGTDTTFKINQDISYSGANCDVYVGKNATESVIIKMFRDNDRRAKEYALIRQIAEWYEKTQGNYFMGFCKETEYKGDLPYCHVFQRISGHPLQETIDSTRRLDQATLISTLTTFLAFLDGVSLLHELEPGYAHWDIKPANIYSFKSSQNSPEIVQMIDFDTAVTATELKEDAEMRFHSFEKDAKYSKWYFSQEIREMRRHLSDNNAYIRSAQALDVFACARILCYMLFAAPLDVGDIEKRLHDPELQARIGLGSAHALQLFFSKALHKNLDKRFLSCREMQEHLSKVIEGIDTNREITCTEAFKIRLGNKESEECAVFYKRFDADLAINFCDTQDGKNPCTLSEIIAQNAKPRTLILGDGGIGKTFSLKKEYFDHLFSEDESETIGVYVSLKSMSVVEEITHKLNALRRELRSEHFMPPQYMIFLDAFDEGSINGSAFRDFLEQNNHIRFVITSRQNIDEGKKAQLVKDDFFYRVHATGLRESQIEQYLKSQNLHLNLQAQSPALLRLLSCPMMLQIFTSIYWDPQDGTAILRTTNEVELIDFYLTRLHLKNESRGYTFEIFWYGLSLIARCIYDHDGQVEAMSRAERGQIALALPLMESVITEKNGVLSCSHQVFEDYFIGIAFAERFDELHKKAEQHQNKKGLIPADHVQKYLQIFPYELRKDRDLNRLRFKGIRIATEPLGDSSVIFERLSSRMQVIFDYHDRICRSERVAFIVSSFLLCFGVLFALPITFPAWFASEQFSAIISNYSIWQRLLMELPIIVYWIFTFGFIRKYVSRSTWHVKELSNCLFNMQCLCQRYSKEGRVCFMPSTVTECEDGILDPRCEKLVLGRDFKDNVCSFLSAELDNNTSAPTCSKIQEIDCTHTRRFRYEKGCLYYKSKKLVFVSPQNQDNGCIHIHIPRRVILEEIGFYSIPLSLFDKQTLYISCEKHVRIKDGGLWCRSFSLSHPFDRIIFDGSPQQWLRITNGKDPIPNYIPNGWGRIPSDSNYFALLTRRKVLTQLGVTDAEFNALKGLASAPIFFTKGNPNVHQVIDIDGEIPEKAYLGSRDFLSLSLPSTRSVGRCAFAMSKTISQIQLPACKIIGAGAFYAATHLADIRSLNNVEEIQSYAFYEIGEHCANDISVSLPACKFIGENAFGHSNLSEINAPLLQEIGVDAFWDTKLKTVELPNCQIIKDTAFFNCHNLTTVSLSKKLTHIGFAAFGICPKLKEIIFAGTIAEWQSITKESPIADTPLLIHCTDGIYTETPPRR